MNELNVKINLMSKHYLRRCGALIKMCSELASSPFIYIYGYLYINLYRICQNIRILEMEGFANSRIFA